MLGDPAEDVREPCLPTSCSFSIAMICSSLNLDRFILRLLIWSGLYLKVEEETGLRSPVMTWRHPKLKFNLLCSLKQPLSPTTPQF